MLVCNKYGMGYLRYGGKVDSFLFFPDRAKDKIKLVLKRKTIL